jgi:hypothetical protein
VTVPINPTTAELNIRTANGANQPVRPHPEWRRTPIELPEPLATLVRDLVAARRGHATIANHGTSPWLFPGGQPGRPISADRLGQRLRRLGLHPAQARATALFQLATELPAAALARMLGIHIKVAVAWQNASASDWTAYAADIAYRRSRKAKM